MESLNEYDLMDELGDMPRERARSSRDYTGGSDTSDFTPAQLAMMSRHFSSVSAPLPDGVVDVGWQPPKFAGLEHSSAIFVKAEDGEEEVRVVSENSHFRSWQEDNGVASNFASETVSKEVDGETRTVRVAHDIPSYSRKLSHMNPSGATRPSTMIVSPSSAGGSSPLVGDEMRVRLALSPAVEDSSSSDSLPSIQAEGAVAAPSPPATGGMFNEKASPNPFPPSKDAVSDVKDGLGISKHCGSSGVQASVAGPSSLGESSATILPALRRTSNALPEGTDDAKHNPEGEGCAIDRPSGHSSDGSAHQILPMPRRPSSGPPSYQAQNPRRGRSHSTKVVDDVMASADSPHPVTPSGGDGERAVVEDDGGAVEGSSGVAAAPMQHAIAVAKAGLDIAVEAARTGGGQDGREGEDDMKEEIRRDPEGLRLAIAPSTKKEKGRGFWLGRSRNPPKTSQRRFLWSSPEPVEEPTQESKLPASVSSFSGSSAAPARRTFSFFRRHRSANAA